MRIVTITAGAAGMYCGSCMRDNTLTAALRELGHDALLVPTFTPITTDEPDVSERNIYFGGVAVYLEQKSWLFRHSPRFIDWLLNRPAFLRWVGRFATQTDYASLGDMTLSMLQGDHGRQKKELAPLVDWLVDEVKPDVVILTNALLSGIVPTLKARLGRPVIVTLQGDDVFLNALRPGDRERCLTQIRENDASVDRYISTSHYYADAMADYIGIDRDKIDVVAPGISLKGHGVSGVSSNSDRVTIGFFARICPDKGFHQLVDAYIRLRQMPGLPPLRLRASGWLGDQHRPYYEQQVARLREAGLIDEFDHVECPDHVSKVSFLQSLDLFSVPTIYREPKGLYLLEAWANGIPVVQPRHGSFPELIEATGGGILVDADSSIALAEGLRELVTDPARRRSLGEAGREGVMKRFTATVMAQETVRMLGRLISPAPSEAVPVS